MGDNHQGPSSAAVLLGFLSGAALGAVAAILLTPRTGQESRDLLRGYARRAEDGLRDLVEDVSFSSLFIPPLRCSTWRYGYCMRCWLSSYNTVGTDRPRSQSR